MKTHSRYFNVGLIILMIGFLMMAACSKDKAKIGTIADGQPDTSISSQTLEEEAAEAKRIREEELAAQRRQAEEEAAIRQKEAAKMSFVNSDIYFNFDDATLTSEARSVLKEKVAYLRANPDMDVTIEGHCDERGTGEYNIALGQRRANSIKTFLINAGVNGSRLNTISYGEEKPVAFGSDEVSWAKNRRGHFRIE